MLTCIAVNLKNARKSTTKILTFYFSQLYQNSTFYEIECLTCRAYPLFLFEAFLKNK